MPFTTTGSSYRSVPTSGCERPRRAWSAWTTIPVSASSAASVDDLELPTVTFDHDAVWKLHAECRNVDPRMFFPEGQGAPGYEAKRVCATCPVRTDCLSDALLNVEVAGIWGGAGDGLRRRLRRLLKASAHPERGVLEGCSCTFDTAIREHFRRLDEFSRIGKRQRGTTDWNGSGATHGKRSTWAKGCRCGGWEASGGKRRPRSRTG